MLVNNAVPFAVLTAAMLLESTTDAASSGTVKLCGRHLSEIMSKVCHAYNSPSWDVPTVEQPGGVARKKRQSEGIATECCKIGCTMKQLNAYCSISAYTDSPLEELESHIIADRSAEQGATESKDVSPPEAVSLPAGHAKSAVHRAAPVVGTVSPLITWGRTLNTDLSATRTNYAYVVYT